MLTTHDVVPDLFPEPQRQMTVVYGDRMVPVGALLTPTAMWDAPTVTWEPAVDKKYTLVEFDPDAPSREDPKWGQWLHWLVANIRGAEIQSGDVLSEYVGAGPPDKTGEHRYIFALFEHDAMLDVSQEPRLTNTSADGHACWSVAAFAQRHSLDDPVALHLVRASYDDSVPKLYAQLGA